MQSTSCTAKRTRAASSDLNLRGVEEPSRTWRSSQLVQITFRSPRAPRPRGISYCFNFYMLQAEEVEHQSQKELASCRCLSLLLRHKAQGLIWSGAVVPLPNLFYFDPRRLRSFMRRYVWNEFSISFAMYSMYSMLYIFTMLLLRLTTFDIIVLNTLNSELQVTCFDHTLDFRGTSLGSRPPSCKKCHKFDMRAQCCRSHCATDFNVLHQLQLLNHEVC